MELFNNPLGIHERALQARSQRLELIAQNIANSDTPQYKARDLDFKQLMNQEQSGKSIRTTDQRHYAIAESDENSFAQAVKFRNPLNPSFDDNTVEMSVEQSNYGKAASDYQATLSFLEGRVSGIRKALKGE